MPIIEERDESEHGEANFAGRLGGGNRSARGGGYQHHQHHNQQPARHNSAVKAKALASAIWYWCGKPGHLANRCSIRLSAFCIFCNAEGHLLLACKSGPNGYGSLGGGAGGSDDESGDQEERMPPPQPRPKLLPYAKKAVARRGAEIRDVRISGSAASIRSRMRKAARSKLRS